MLIGELESYCLQNREIQEGKALYFTLHCDISYIFVPDSLDRQMFYLACPSCKKKVIED